METLFKGFEDYKNNVYPQQKELMESLEKGQKPHTFLVTCADSRISVNEFSQTKPGEVFVIRNAGNIVPAYDPNRPESLMVTLEYGVCALEIPEIVVCGHRGCGAMGGILQLDSLGAVPLVQKGLKTISEQYKFNLNEIKDLDDLIIKNVHQQLHHLNSYPFIKERVQSGKLNVWGWVYDFSHAEVTHKVNLKEIL